MQQFRFRSTPTWGMSTDAHIDHENAIIYGVTAMMAGVEAIGHGVMADEKTLTKLADLGNAKTRGIKGRFGHPGSSENATGKQVQLARSFRVVGNKLIHDSHLLNSARKSPAFSQDPIEFILEVADSAPTEFGESVVIAAGTVWPLEDGREIPVEVDPWSGGYYYPEGKPSDVEFDDNRRPTTATSELPVMRPEVFYYVDFVNEGALTHDGMFSVNMAADLFSGHSSEFALELFDLVDRWREQYQVPLDQIPLKVDQLTAKYLAARGLKGEYIMARKSTRRFSADEVEPVAAATEDPIEATATDEVVEDDDDVDAELERAEALAADIEDEGEEDEQAVTIEELQAFSAELAKVMSEVSKLSQIVEQHGKRMGSMAKLLTQNLEATQTVQRNMKQLAGEPLERVAVPRFNTNTALEELGIQPQQTPRPNQFMMGAQAPAGVRKLGATGAEQTDYGDPTTNALAHMSRLSRLANQRTEG